MKKIYAASAIASVLGAPSPALAQQPGGSTVQIYGTLNLNFQNASRKGATAPGTPGLATLAGGASGINATSRNAISRDSSNIGFRGSENLGGGLRATFQIETSANIDGEGLAGIGTRNSKVGLAGGFGELFLGYWDTPFKAATYGTHVNDPFRSTDVFGYQSIMGSPGFNQRSGTYASGTNNASFDNRAANTVNYWTPVWSGLRGKLAYSVNEGKTAARNPYLWSFAVNYDRGNLSLLYAYERHEDAFGLTVMQAASTGTSSKDWGHRAGAGYHFGNITLSVLWDRLEFRNSGTVAGVTHYERDAWQLAALHRSGPHEMKLRYNRAEDGSCASAAGNCSTNGLGARQWTAGYGYHFSKRTELFAFYTKIRNESSASYTFTVGGPAAVVTGPGIGSDPEAAGIGIRHAF